MTKNHILALVAVISFAIPPIKRNEVDHIASGRKCPEVVLQIFSLASKLLFLNGIIASSDEVNFSLNCYGLLPSRHALEQGGEV